MLSLPKRFSAEISTGMPWKWYEMVTRSSFLEVISTPIYHGCFDIHSTDPRLPRFCRVGRVGWTQTCQAERYSRQNLILKLGQRNANLPGKTRQAKEPSTIVLGHWKFQFIKYCSLSMLFPIACSSPQLLAYHVSQLTNSVAKHLWAVSLCSNYCFGDKTLQKNHIFQRWSLDISWLDMAVDRTGPTMPKPPSSEVPIPTSQRTVH